MRKQDHVVHAVQRAHRMAECASGSWLNTSSAAPAMRFLAQRHDQRRLVHDRAARHVDQEGRRLHQRRVRRAPIRWRVSSFSTAWIETTSLCCQQRVQVVDLLDAPCPHRLRRHMRIVADHPHAEARRHARHAAADLAGADDARACGRRDRARAIAASARPSLSRPSRGRSASASWPARSSARTRLRRPSPRRIPARSRPECRARSRPRMSIASMPTPYLTMPLSLRRAVDHARGDRRVAHQQEVGVAHRRDQLVLADALRQQHKLAARRAQARVDLRAFELAVGADGLEARRRSAAVPIGEIPGDRRRDAEDRDERADLVDQRNAGL